jgi:hypothetical protein
MSPQRLTEIMKNYRTSRARCAWLQEQLKMLDRFLKICEGEMVEDMMSMSQALTGMPHGTTVGDPTGRLALDIESGKISPFVKEIREEIEHTNSELLRVSADVRAVDIVLEAMTDRERNLLEMKMIDELSWTEIISRMNQKYGGKHKQRTLQRMTEKIMEKAVAIVK